MTDDTEDTWDNCTLQGFHIWDPTNNPRRMQCARCDKYAPAKSNMYDMRESRLEALWATPTTVAEIREVAQERQPDSVFGAKVIALMGGILRDDEQTTILSLCEAAKTADPDERDENLAWGHDIMRGIQLRWEAENVRLFTEDT